MDSDDEDKAPHRRAVIYLIIAATMWSIAGVVTRHLSPELQQQGRFEITFWRSVFAALCVGVFVLIVHRQGLKPFVAAGWPGVFSGCLWAVMYTAFMLALTLTSTANTLLVSSLGPLITALLAWAVLRTPIQARTWVAIAAAMLGIAVMVYGTRSDGQSFSAQHLLGMLIAFGVPVASATNLVLMQKTRARVDLVPAVLLGGVFSAAAMAVVMAAQGSSFPLAQPMDIALLALLGVFQLGLPCMLLVVAARHLSAPEIALLALLEVVLGPLWAWLGAGETPSSPTLFGGALVLLALVFNELIELRRKRDEQQFLFSDRLALLRCADDGLD